MSGIYFNRFNREFFNKSNCRANVGSGFYSSQCRKPGVVERTVNGETYKFCRQHDPEAVAARQSASKERREAKWAADAAKHERQRKVEKATKACVKSIARIAQGHPNPVALAKSTLRLFPADWTVDD